MGQPAVALRDPSGGRERGGAAQARVWHRYTLAHTGANRRLVLLHGTANTFRSVRAVYLPSRPRDAWIYEPYPSRSHCDDGTRKGGPREGGLYGRQRRDGDY